MPAWQTAENLPTMSDPIQQVAELLATSTRAVAFTGAGISTESGIPDFRSPGGVWSNNRQVYYDEFLADADARYEYWRQKCIAQPEMSRAAPNDGHLMLARWEEAGRLTGVITQNIDGLHQRAGSRTVWEVHGTAMQIVCVDFVFHRDRAGFVRLAVRQASADAPARQEVSEAAVVVAASLLGAGGERGAAELAAPDD